MGQIPRSTERISSGIIIPLLKNKHGDVASSDMNHGITLSSTVSKLFDCWIYLVTIFRVTYCNMVLRKMLAARMHYLHSMNLYSILCPEEVEFSVFLWIQIKHLIERYIRDFYLNCYRKGYLLNLLNFFVFGVVGRPVLYCRILY